MSPPTSSIRDEQGRDREAEVKRRLEEAQQRIQSSVQEKLKAKMREKAMSARPGSKQVERIVIQANSKSRRRELHYSSHSAVRSTTRKIPHELLQSSWNTKKEHHRGRKTHLNHAGNLLRSRLSVRETEDHAREALTLPSLSMEQPIASHATKFEGDPIVHERLTETQSYLSQKTERKPHPTYDTNLLRSKDRGAVSSKFEECKVKGSRRRLNTVKHRDASGVSLRNENTTTHVNKIVTRGTTSHSCKQRANELRKHEVVKIEDCQETTIKKVTSHEEHWDGNREDSFMGSTAVRPEIEKVDIRKSEDEQNGSEKTLDSNQVSNSRSPSETNDVVDKRISRFDAVDVAQMSTSLSTANSREDTSSTSHHDNVVILYGELNDVKEQGHVCYSDGKNLGVEAAAFPETSIKDKASDASATLSYPTTSSEDICSGPTIHHENVSTLYEDLNDLKEGKHVCRAGDDFSCAEARTFQDTRINDASSEVSKLSYETEEWEQWAYMDEEASAFAAMVEGGGKQNELLFSESLQSVGNDVLSKTLPNDSIGNTCDSGTRRDSDKKLAREADYKMKMDNSGDMIQDRHVHWSESTQSLRCPSNVDNHVSTSSIDGSDLYSESSTTATSSDASSGDKRNLVPHTARRGEDDAEISPRIASADELSTEIDERDALHESQSITDKTMEDEEQMCNLEATSKRTLATFKAANEGVCESSQSSPPAKEIDLRSSETFDGDDRYAILSSVVNTIVSSVDDEGCGVLSSPASSLVQQDKDESSDTSLLASSLVQQDEVAKDFVSDDTKDLRGSDALYISPSEDGSNAINKCATEANDAKSISSEVTKDTEKESNNASFESFTTSQTLSTEPDTPPGETDHSEHSSIGNSDAQDSILNCLPGETNFEPSTIPSIAKTKEGVNMASEEENAGIPVTDNTKEAIVPSTQPLFVEDEQAKELILRWLVGKNDFEPSTIPSMTQPKKEFNIASGEATKSTPVTDKKEESVVSSIHPSFVEDEQVKGAQKTELLYLSRIAVTSDKLSKDSTDCGSVSSISAMIRAFLPLGDKADPMRNSETGDNEADCSMTSVADVSSVDSSLLLVPSSNESIGSFSFVLEKSKGEAAVSSINMENDANIAIDTDADANVSVSNEMSTESILKPSWAKEEKTKVFHAISCKEGHTPETCFYSFDEISCPSASFNQNATERETKSDNADAEDADKPASIEEVTRLRDEALEVLERFKASKCKLHEASYHESCGSTSEMMIAAFADSILSLDEREGSEGDHIVDWPRDNPSKCTDSARALASRKGIEQDPESESCQSQTTKQLEDKFASLEKDLEIGATNLQTADEKSLLSSANDKNALKGYIIEECQVFVPNGGQGMFHNLICNRGSANEDYTAEEGKEIRSMGGSEVLEEASLLVVCPPSKRQFFPGWPSRLHTKEDRKKAVLFASIVIILILCASIAVGLSVGAKDDAPIVLTGGSEPSVSRTERITKLLRSVSGSSINDDSTPQHKALLWMINVDQHPLPFTSQRIIQRYVLVLLYFATQGQNWASTRADSTSFLNERRSECRWEGIRCKSDLVDRIRLGRNKLNGPLPPEISRLGSLIHLDLHDNLMSGLLPDSIGDLHELEHLNLAQNEFSGEIPDTLGEMDNLEACHLHTNSFKGAVPLTMCLLRDEANLRALSADCGGDEAQLECACCTACY